MVDTTRLSITAIGWDRRTFLKASGLTVGGLSLAGLIAACGGGGAGGGAGGQVGTLKLPFINDMQIPDPDIMYEGEGALVTHAAYEGLAHRQRRSGDWATPPPSTRRGPLVPVVSQRRRFKAKRTQRITWHRKSLARKISRCFR
ncbi:MAG: ABC-type dipeptide transport system, periplasmic component [Mycobacterium sp.]|nr:ABC-type dipeptide transport system, periplasmic component [Mycobacterium sp.]